MKIRKNGMYKKMYYPIFPGYFFTNVYPGALKKDWAKYIRGFVGFVGNKGRGRILRQGEKDQLFHLVNEDGIIEMSYATMESQIITIKAGPLRGYEGKIISINKRKHRAKIDLTIDDVSRSIDIGLECVKLT